MGEERDSSGDALQHISGLQASDLVGQLKSWNERIAHWIRSGDTIAWRPVTYPAFEVYAAANELPLESPTAKPRWRSGIAFLHQENRARVTTLLQAYLSLVVAGDARSDANAVAVWGFLADAWQLDRSKQPPATFCECFELAKLLTPTPTWLPGYVGGDDDGA